MFPSFAGCFIPVDGSTSYKLEDLKPTGMQAMMGDLIQTLNPATTDQNGQYCYFSKEESRSYDEGGAYDYLIGWWKDGLEVERADETEIPVGTAFLGAVVSGAGIDFQSSGEAPTYTTKFTTDGGAFPFFGNFIPKELKFKDIVVVGMGAMLGDLIQTLDPETADQNGQYCYFSYEESRSYDEGGAYDYLIGWWKGGLEVERADDMTVPAGTAFLGAISSGTQEIEFKFPSVLESAE